MTLYKTLISKIKNLIKDDRLLIVGIDGIEASGKSEIAKKLNSNLKENGINSIIISIDDFCLPKKYRYRIDEPENIQVYKYNFDEQQFLNNVLKSIFNSTEYNYSFNSLVALTDKKEKYIEYNIDSPGVIVVEGIHIFKKKYVNYYDLRIFVEINYDTQWIRAMKRDPLRGNSKDDIIYKYNKRYRPSFEHYFKEDKPLKNIHWFIDNNDWNNPKLIKNTKTNTI